MLYPSINELLEKTENRYVLVNQVAKRAREIVDERIMLKEKKEKTDGGQVKPSSVPYEEKPVSLATNEVYEDKISYITIETDENDIIIE